MDTILEKGKNEEKKAAEKGIRKEQMMLSVVKDNGVEVQGESAVVECYMEEFKSRLANREPKPGWEQYTHETNVTVRNWLKGDSLSSPSFSDEEINTVLASLNEDSSAGVDRYIPRLFKKQRSRIWCGFITEAVM